MGVQPGPKHWAPHGSSHAVASASHVAGAGDGSLGVPRRSHRSLLPGPPCQPLSAVLLPSRVQAHLHLATFPRAFHPQNAPGDPEVSLCQGSARWRPRPRLALVPPSSGQAVGYKVYTGGVHTSSHPACDRSSLNRKKRFLSSSDAAVILSGK